MPYHDAIPTLPSRQSSLYGVKLYTFPIFCRTPPPPHSSLLYSPALPPYLQVWRYLALAMFGYRGMFAEYKVSPPDQPVSQLTASLLSHKTMMCPLSPSLQTHSLPRLVQHLQLEGSIIPDMLTLTLS